MRTRYSRRLKVEIFILGFAVGIAVSGAASWLLMKAKISAAGDVARAQAAGELAAASERIRASSDQAARLETALTEAKANLDISIASLREAMDVKASLEANKATLETRVAAIPELQARLNEKERELSDALSQIRTLSQESGRINAELQSENNRIAELRAALDGETQRRGKAETDIAQLSVEHAELKARLEAELTQSTEKITLLMNAKNELSNQFKTLANEIFEDKSARFTKQNQDNLAALLNPVKTQLTGFQSKLEEVHTQSNNERVKLSEQLRHMSDLNKTLHHDTKNLTDALKGSNKIQGNWGELILERVLESAGLTKGREFDVQESHIREDGTRAQPDVVIKLPEGRYLVVDAKVSLTAFTEYVAAQSDEDRQDAAQRHVKSLRTHIDGLTKRNYQQIHGAKSPDFVVMFIPVEPAYMLALSHDQEILTDGSRLNIVLACPSTFLFIVHTVAFLWRQDAQVKNVQEIAKAGADLYDKFVGFVKDFSAIGDKLKSATETYEDALGKLSACRGNLVRRAETLKALGVKPAKSLPQDLVDVAIALGGLTSNDTEQS